MKHVFVVHSPITYLAALGVICKYNININQVYIVSEGYYRKTPIPILVLPIMSRRNPFIFMFPIQYVDYRLNKLIGNDSFVAYVPAMYSLAKIVSTNLKCKSFHFIEEGLSVYAQNIPLQWYYHTKPSLGFRNNKIKNIITSFLHTLQGYNEILDSFPFLYNAYVNVENILFFGFSEKSYIGAIPVLIDLKEVRRSFFSNYVCSLKSDIVIWIGTYFREDDKLDNYINVIDKYFIRYLQKNGISHIQIKFHPSELILSRKKTLALFNSHSISYDVLCDNTILEIELQCVKNVRLFGTSSSVLYYASIWGHKSFSVTKYLVNFPQHDIPVFDTEVSTLEVENDLFDKY